MANDINLATDKWIPAGTSGRVSLIEAFSDESIREIGGNAIQKMACYKLLFAVAQAACRVTDDREWSRLKAVGLGRKCVIYLRAHAGEFELYGPWPFLQYPELREKNVPVQEIEYDYIPDIVPENDMVFKETQFKDHVSDEEKAVFLLMLMNYAFAGKRVSDPSTYLEKPDGRRKSAKSGPSIGSGGSAGYRQSMLLGSSVLETVYLNFMTDEDIRKAGMTRDTEVLPPWERMPELESTEYGEAYRNSFWSWYVALSRAVLLEDGGIRYCEGMVYTGPWWEPFVSRKSAKGGCELVDPARKAWYTASALLEEAFIGDSSESRCYAIAGHFLRTRKRFPTLTIWTGGLKVRGTGGEQFVKQSDDFADSSVTFESAALGQKFYMGYRSLIKDVISGYASVLGIAIRRYQYAMGYPRSALHSRAQEESFWSEMDRMADTFVRRLAEDRETLEKDIFLVARDIYDRTCPHENARQVLAWIDKRPHWTINKIRKGK